MRAVGAVTEAICASRPGAVLGVRGPFGNAWPVEEAAGERRRRDRAAASGSRRSGRPSTTCSRTAATTARSALLYGSRTPADLLYRDELERWRGRFDLQVDVTVDAADGGWHGKVGVVPKLIAGARVRPGADGRVRRAGRRS